MRALSCRGGRALADVHSRLQREQTVIRVLPHQGRCGDAARGQPIYDVLLIQADSDRCQLQAHGHLPQATLRLLNIGHPARQAHLLAGFDGAGHAVAQSAQALLGALAVEGHPGGPELELDVQGSSHLLEQAGLINFPQYRLDALCAGTGITSRKGGSAGVVVFGAGGPGPPRLLRPLPGGRTARLEKRPPNLRQPSNGCCILDALQRREGLIVQSLALQLQLEDLRICLLVLIRWHDPAAALVHFLESVGRQPPSHALAEAAQDVRIEQHASAFEVQGAKMQQTPRSCMQEPEIQGDGSYEGRCCPKLHSQPGEVEDLAQVLVFFVLGRGRVPIWADALHDHLGHAHS
mmetsp:Transcript_91378/g.295519  ORF Transcript_91378/g.295519 Transcript_91378/m.295519 type:complete len:349 (+) Transcript_91378:3891-4937(+)